MTKLEESFSGFGFGPNKRTAFPGGGLDQSVEDILNKVLCLVMIWDFVRINVEQHCHNFCYELHWIVFSEVMSVKFSQQIRFYFISNHLSPMTRNIEHRHHFHITPFRFSVIIICQCLQAIPWRWLFGLLLITKQTSVYLVDLFSCLWALRWDGMQIRPQE